MIARGVNRMPALVALAATLAACGVPAGEGDVGGAVPVETVDLDVVAELRDEGFNRSRVMEFAHVLTDLYGPRYANSPSYDGAANWARDTFEEFGLDATLDAWGEFGYAWENRHTSVHITAPQYQPVIGYAQPGTRGTNGKVTGPVAAVDLSSVETRDDLEALQARLGTSILLVSPQRELVPNFWPQAVRLSDEELSGMARLEIDPLNNPSRSTDDEEAEPGQRVLAPPASQSERPSAGGRMPPELTRHDIETFLEQQGVAVLVEIGTTNVGPMDKGIVHVSGDGPLPLDEAVRMPRVVIAAEHYNRMMRLLAAGTPVEMEIEVRNELSADDPLDYNVIAELPGADLAHEVVMIGGHLDAEPAGTGATDNAAGSAIVMEAMRLLQAAGLEPRRTIRAALWGAEESGLLGSRAYVREHFGDPASPEKPTAHANLSVYFNVDWYGRFRGIYLQGNDESRPIFEAWMEPFHDVGMSWIVPGNTGGTDHMAFLEAGLQGYQFIQDDLEFFNATFHTNMDVYDRLIADDLRQASVILASFAYHAAMRDELFPRTDGLANGRRWHK